MIKTTLMTSELLSGGGEEPTWCVGLVCQSLRCRLHFSIDNIFEIRGGLDDCAGGLEGLDD